MTLIEGRDRLLGFLDAELSSALKVSLERMGADVILGDAVENLSRVPGLSEDALRLTLKSGRELVAGKVLFSAGRRGNTEGLGLEAAGVAFDEKGRIPVDATFLTNVPGIYAAGDIIGFPALAATSMEQGRTAVKNALGLAGPDDRKLPFPYGVYTIPEISMIGSTEEELREKGTPYEVGRARYENNARGQINGDVDGFVKLLFDPETKRLLGAHLLGTNATELVHVPQMVMAHGGGLADFLDAVFNVPTLSECFKYAAYDGLQRLSHQGRGVPVEIAAPVAAGEVLPPGARGWFVGVDLTDLSAASPRPVDVAFMDRWRRVRFATWTYAPDGEGLLPDGDPPRRRRRRDRRPAGARRPRPEAARGGARAALRREDARHAAGAGLGAVRRVPPRKRPPLLGAPREGARRLRRGAAGPGGPPRGLPGRPLEEVGGARAPEEADRRGAQGAVGPPARAGARAAARRGRDHPRPARRRRRGPRRLPLGHGPDERVGRGPALGRGRGRPPRGIRRQPLRSDAGKPGGPGFPDPFSPCGPGR